MTSKVPTRYDLSKFQHEDGMNCLVSFYDAGSLIDLGEFSNLMPNAAYKFLQGIDGVTNVRVQIINQGEGNERRKGTTSSRQSKGKFKSSRILN